MIPTPKELIGQKITPFMEWCNQNTNSYGNITQYDLYLRVKQFKSQPFTTEMLIGENKIFEGWEYDKDFDLYKRKNSDYIRLSERGTNNFIKIIGSINNSNWYFKSLNDFISLCQMAGVELGKWDLQKNF